MITYAISFVLSFAIVMVLIPPLAKLAFRLDFVDKPRKDVERKIHREPIPLTASYAIFVGFAASFLLFSKESPEQTVAVLIGSLLLLTIGTIDDWYKTQGKDFSALPKLIVQLSAAVIVYMSGITFSGFYNPLSGEYILLPEWLQFVLTILWIFGVTTVINFSDGMDGLAGGLSAISAEAPCLLWLSSKARTLPQSWRSAWSESLSPTFATTSRPRKFSWGMQGRLFSGSSSP